MDHGQRLDARHHREPRPHVDAGIGAHRGDRPRCRRAVGARLATRQPPEEGVDLLVARMERNHVVVVLELPDLDQVGLVTVPRVLVVQHHRPAVQRLHLGRVLCAVDDVLEPVPGVVRVVVPEPEGQVGGVGEDLRDRRLGRCQLGGVVPAMPEHVEEDGEDPVLRLLVERRGQRLVGAPDRLHLLVGILPAGEDRQEHVGTASGHIGPPGWPLLEQREGEPPGPEHVQSDVAHQLVAARVPAFLDSPQDVGAGRRLRLEVATDDRVELLEAVDGGQVELRHEVGREDDPVMAVDQEGLHGAPALGQR